MIQQINFYPGVHHHHVMDGVFYLADIKGIPQFLFKLCGHVVGQI